MSSESEQRSVRCDDVITSLVTAIENMNKKVDQAVSSSEVKESLLNQPPVVDPLCPSGEGYVRLRTT